jgi:hypothetical protein
MLRQSALFLLASMALTDCAAPNMGPNQAAFDASIRRDVSIGNAQCAAQFPIGPRTNHVAQAQCFNKYEVAVIRPRARYPDISVLVNAKRLAIAEQADQGTLTEAAAQAAMAEVLTSAISESDRRDNAAAQTQAQNAAARAAQSSAMSAAMSAPNPFAAPPANRCMVLIGGRCQ